MDEQEPTCQVCGYITGTTDGDICPVCDWECSWVQGDYPDATFGPNGGVTLRKAQQNFLKFGACDAKSADHLDPLEERLAQFQKDPNWKPLPPPDIS